MARAKAWSALGDGGQRGLFSLPVVWVAWSKELSPMMMRCSRAQARRARGETGGFSGFEGRKHGLVSAAFVRDGSAKCMNPYNSD